MRDMTITEALACPPPTGPARTNPAVMFGGAILPAPLLAAKVAPQAAIRPVIHPGDALPSRVMCRRGCWRRLCAAGI